MKTIQKHCAYCNNLFDANLREHNRGNAKYCSKECVYLHMSATRTKTDTNCSCAYCNSEFYRSPSKIKEINFCSRKCKDTAQQIGSGIPVQPSHYGDELSSYRAKALRAFEHKCDKCGYNEYAEVLHVHHKDCNRNNNDISNLVILCPTCHYVEHYVVLKQPIGGEYGI